MNNHYTARHPKKISLIIPEEINLHYIHHEWCNKPLSIDAKTNKETQVVYCTPPNHQKAGGLMYAHQNNAPRSRLNKTREKTQWKVDHCIS